MNEPFIGIEFTKIPLIILKDPFVLKYWFYKIITNSVSWGLWQDEYRILELADVALEYYFEVITFEVAGDKS